jgi:hypothetical protein
MGRSGSVIGIVTMNVSAGNQLWCVELVVISERSEGGSESAGTSSISGEERRNSHVLRFCSRKLAPLRAWALRLIPLLRDNPYTLHIHACRAFKI